MFFVSNNHNVIEMKPVKLCISYRVLNTVKADETIWMTLLVETFRLLPVPT